MRKNRTKSLYLLALLFAAGVPHARAAETMPPAPPVNAAPAAGIATPSIAPAPSLPAPVAIADEVAPEPAKSIFFSDAQVNALRAAMRRYMGQGGMPGDTMLPEGNIAGATPQTGGANPAAIQYFTYPQFFLDSLIYHSKADWIVWINDRKITQENAVASPDLQVLGIDHEKVTLKWRPADMRRVQDTWARTPNDQVDFDPLAGTLTFTLHHNQTFSSYAMKVLEGRVTPVTVEVTPESQALRSGASAIPAAAEGMAAPDAEGSGEGLGGLLNAYQKLESHKPEPTPEPAKEAP